MVFGNRFDNISQTHTNVYRELGDWIQVDLKELISYKNIDPPYVRVTTYYLYSFRKTSSFACANR